MNYGVEQEGNTYAEMLMTKLSDLGFDNWDIKPEDLEYIFSNRKFRVFHDFLLKYLKHDHVLTDAELICFKDIAVMMVDKTKSDNLISRMRKDDRSVISDDIFTLDSFSDDDNLLNLDELDSINISKIHKSSASLDIIDEEFDNYEDALKQLDQHDLETLQMKLGLELNRHEIEHSLGIDTEDTLKQQLISMDSEINILDKEEQMLLMELNELERFGEDAKLDKGSMGNDFDAINDHEGAQMELEKEISTFTTLFRNTLDGIGAKISDSIDKFIPMENCEFTHSIKISQKSVDTVVNQISEFCDKLTKTHDVSLELLKSQNKQSAFVKDEEMHPLIETTFDIEKH
jgi:hypothetical protein